MPKPLAEALDRPPWKGVADGGAVGLLGGPEPDDPLFREIEDTCRARAVDLEVSWGEPLGHALAGRAARSVFGGAVLPGDVLRLGTGAIDAKAHGLYDPNEKEVFFEDIRRDGEPTAVRRIEGRHAGALAAVVRPERRGMAPMVEVLTIMAALRGEGGCPWDKKQDHLTLRTYLLEEAAEVVDALTDGPTYKIREELGDLLLQIVFHTRLFEEEGLFGFEDVAATLGDKLVRRHPHVFGSARLEGAPEVLVQWDRIKREEVEGKRSLLDEVPKSFGSLEAASKVLKLMRRLDLPFPDVPGPGGRMVRLAGDLLEEGLDPALVARDGAKPLRDGLQEAERQAWREGSELVEWHPGRRQKAFLQGYDASLARKKED